MVNDITTTYTYDDFSNRATKQVGSESATDYIYDLNNRLETETTVLGSETEITNYHYDANGNQYSTVREVVKPIEDTLESVSVSQLGESTESYVTFNSYNGFNQLTEVQKDDVVASYTYDASGIRKSKTVNGVITSFITDSGYVIVELNDSDQVSAIYTYGTNLISVDNTDGLGYYLFNGHGDVTEILETDGRIRKTYDDDAFGNEVTPDASDINPFRYSGEYFDKETGTIYLRARYYNPVIGRFISEDTYGGALMIR